MTRKDGYFVELATKYAKEAVSGKIICGKLVILACRRFLNDLEKQKEDSFDFEFSVARAEHACQFMEYLPHIKGEKAFANELLKLEPWQAFIICNIFGWLKKGTSFRRFLKVYIEIARKNGKTFLGSGIALYCGVADREQGAEVYIAASNHSQALICFDEAKSIISKDKELCEHFGIEYNKRNIYIPTTSSKIKALPKDQHGSLDGLNIHCAIVDELHAHQKPDTYNALMTGTGARNQPLVVSITTAGFNRTAICYEQRAHTKNILENVYEDDTSFGIIYTIDESDDWTDPNVWIKANPNLGVSVNAENFKSECLSAQKQITKKNFFLTKHLNVWVGANTAWMDMDKWNACADATLKEEDLKDLPLFVAADLAGTKDFCSIARVYLEKKKDETGQDINHYYLFADHFLNETAIEQNKIEEVRAWAQAGYINETRGDVTDLRIVENKICEIALLKPKAIGFDRYQAAYMIQNLNAARIKNVFEYPQNIANMSSQMKELEAAVLSGRLKHNGDPVLGWMISNVVAKIDNKDNIYPNRDKNAPHQKIDGAIASIMAIGLALKQQPKAASFRMFTI